MANSSRLGKDQGTKAGGPRESVAVTVRLDRIAAASFEEIVKELRRAGLTDVAPHERLMMVSGNVDSRAIDALRAVRGVASVRADQKYRTS